MGRRGLALCLIGIVGLSFLAAGCRGGVWQSHPIGMYPSQVATSEGWQDWDPAGKLPDAPPAKFEASCYSETLGRSRGSAPRDNRVRIQVHDLSRQEASLLLNDELFFKCCEVHAYVRWEEFETLEVELIEEGEWDDASANGTYSIELARNGPRRLARLTYVYDKSAGKFVRARTGFPPDGSIDVTSTMTAKWPAVVDRARQQVLYLLRGDYYVTYRGLYDSADRSVSLAEVETAFRNAARSYEADESSAVADTETAWYVDTVTGETIARVTLTPQPGQSHEAGEPLVVFVLDSWDTKLTGISGRKLVRIDRAPD